MLVLEDGRHAEIVAADEELLEIRGRDPVHLASLAWHIGNRHLAAAIEAERILILRDHVIKAMLEGLGAAVREVVRAVQPAPRRLFRRPWPRPRARAIRMVMAITHDHGHQRTTCVDITHGHRHESTGMAVTR